MTNDNNNSAQLRCVNKLFYQSRAGTDLAACILKVGFSISSAGCSSCWNASKVSRADGASSKMRRKMRTPMACRSSGPLSTVKRCQSPKRVSFSAGVKNSCEGEGRQQPLGAPVRHGEDCRRRTVVGTADFLTSAKYWDGLVSTHPIHTRCQIV